MITIEKIVSLVKERQSFALRQAQDERCDMLKSCNFSSHAEPFDSPFPLRLSKGERFAQDRLVEA